MPQSHVSLASSRDLDEDHEIQEDDRQAIRNAFVPRNTAPNHISSWGSEADLRQSGTARAPPPPPPDEYTGLLTNSETSRSGYKAITTPSTPRATFRRAHSYVSSIRLRREPSVRETHGGRVHGLDDTSTASRDTTSATQALYFDDRVWYDQFTSTDWVHDSIADAYRVKELKNRRDIKGRVQAFFDGAQGWLLSLIIGCITAGLAYVIDVTEATIFDYKTGYCTTGWWRSKRKCCDGVSMCDNWARWADALPVDGYDRVWGNFVAFVFWVVLLSVLGCWVTLQTKTTISSAVSISTLDENLGADHHHKVSKSNSEGRDRSLSPTRRYQEAARRPPVVYYPAAGSGVAEVRVILSGFVLHGYLGVKTLVCKMIGLIFSVGSGLSIGKEGPYVHIATCVGNIVSRMSSKYKKNDGKRREILSAAAAAGVAVAFGAPIGGVLFSLEEVSYYFPPKTLFRTFFCCIAAALSLKFLNPYGTNKIVLFEVRYLTDWKLFEIIAFCCLGILGGALGALFIKASRLWAKTFRKIKYIKEHPMLEVVIVALVTGLVTFWNRYTRLPVAELLFELSAPCDTFSSTDSGLCPTEESIPDVIWVLCIGFFVKAILTTITFGIKVPAGIYVPSMVVGGFLGRIVGHIVQLLVLKNPNIAFFANCPNDGNPESCVVPGVYALVAAGATMCGVTRLSVTLAVILFELTGSLAYVLPFSLGVLIAKWTADALEPLSIYDLLTDMNAYPYLDTKIRPVFTTDLGDITLSPPPSRYIDITTSPLVPAKQLRSKLEYMHMAGELDGGLPILRDRILVGLIPGPDLEFALDKLESEVDVFCLMDPHEQWQGAADSHLYNSFAVDSSVGGSANRYRDDDEAQPFNSTGGVNDPTDFTPYIDRAPVALDISSPMDLVFECFVKLGLRYVCVLREGKFAGLVHKKTFVRYVKNVQQEGSG